MHLLALPEELISVIVDTLSCDRQALHNLCLVGNHVLLAITRPVIWREVTFHVDLDSREHSSLSLSLFTADKERARSVHAIRLTFSGSYDHDLLITRLLQESLKRLINLKQAYLGFFESTDGALSDDEDDENDEDDEDDDDYEEKDTRSLLEVVLQSLVPLESVQVNGYSSSAASMKTPMEFPRLKSLVMDYCSPSVINTWAGARNLEVIELGGGAGRRFYEDNVQKHSERWFRGYDRGLIGARNLLNEVLLGGGYYNHLRRLLIASDVGGDKYDIINMVAFFEVPLFSIVDCHENQTLNVLFTEVNPNSLPALEELVLGFVFTITEYQVILNSVASPRLKRLMMKYDCSFRDRAQLEHLFVQSLYSWQKFTSLEELWLPMEGVIENELDNLQPALSMLKNLTHLYFTEIDGDDYEDDITTIIEDITKELAARLPRLEEISWEESFTVQIHRNQKGRVRSLTVWEDYEQPEWQLFSKNKRLYLADLDLR